MSEVEEKASVNFECWTAHTAQAWNGVAERFFDTFCMIRSMIETSHLPGVTRNYASQHACCLFNDCSKYPTWQTPSVKWEGTTPDISRHRVFGCRAYTHINRPLGTLDS